MIPVQAHGIVAVPDPDLKSLFHELNNQLGIILANAELLEARLTDPAQRARSEQIVASVLNAITTARSIRVACQPHDR